MYQDFYLCFTNEAEARPVLYTAHPAVTDEEGNVTQEAYTTPNYANIDVLGVLYNDDVVLDEEGDVVTPATPIDGWHVNVRAVPGEDAAALEPFRVDPEPMMWRRVWG